MKDIYAVMSFSTSSFVYASGILYDSILARYHDACACPPPRYPMTFMLAAKAASTPDDES